MYYDSSIKITYYSDKRASSRAQSAHPSKLAAETTVQQLLLLLLRSEPSHFGSQGRYGASLETATGHLCPLESSMRAWEPEMYSTKR